MLLLLLLLPGVTSLRPLRLPELPKLPDLSTWFASLPFLPPSDIGQTCHRGTRQGVCRLRNSCGGSVLSWDTYCTPYKTVCCTEEGGCGSTLSGAVAYLDGGSTLQRASGCSNQVRIQKNTCFLRAEFELQHDGHTQSQEYLQISAAAGTSKPNYYFSGDFIRNSVLVPVRAGSMVQISHNIARADIRLTQQECATTATKFDNGNRKPEKIVSANPPRISAPPSKMSSSEAEELRRTKERLKEIRRGSTGVSKEFFKVATSQSVQKSKYSQGWFLSWLQDRMAQRRAELNNQAASNYRLTKPDLLPASVGKLEYEGTGEGEVYRISSNLALVHGDKVPPFPDSFAVRFGHRRAAVKGVILIPLLGILVLASPISMKTPCRNSGKKNFLVLCKEEDDTYCEMTARRVRPSRCSDSLYSNHTLPYNRRKGNSAGKDDPFDFFCVKFFTSCSCQEGERVLVDLGPGGSSVVGVSVDRGVLLHDTPTYSRFIDFNSLDGLIQAATDQPTVP